MGEVESRVLSATFTLEHVSPFPLWYRLHPLALKCVRMSHPAIYPPAKLSLIEHTVFSIDAALPRRIHEEIQRYADEDQIPWATEAQHALRLYRESFMTREDYARDNIEDRIRALRQRPRKLSPSKREELRGRVLEEIFQLHSEGRIGTLTLSIELYNFVRSRIESGKAISVADIFIEALPFLRAERGKIPCRCVDGMFSPLDFY